ncbi:hypothetical protein JW988_03070 [Candidatus Bathyarchaeota archaeon]|nr:hypothetical protein [Candidatus Bathyarchaeota archaeon]
MAESKFYSPLKIGLFTVSIAYFLFSLHALFTLSWIGEWNVLRGSAWFWILITDVSAYFGLVFRFIASLIAVATIVFYFAKKGLPESTVFKVLKWILVLEALYWVPLFLSGLMGLMPVDLSGIGATAGLSLSLLITTGIPCLVSSIFIPVALFKLAFKLKPNKPPKDAIKWSLVAGTLYVFVFWLNNMGMWIATFLLKGETYFSAYPENMFSFVLTVYGLPVLVAFTAYVAGKTIAVGTDTLEKLNLRPIGAVITALGLYFLWNYLTWIFFGGNHLWSDWYAWFLGHNLDLWMLSLPLVGLPLLFKRNNS